MSTLISNVLMYLVRATFSAENFFYRTPWLATRFYKLGEWLCTIPAAQSTCFKLQDLLSDKRYEGYIPTAYEARGDEDWQEYDASQSPNYHEGF